MEKILEQVLMELKDIKESQAKIETNINTIQKDIDELKMDGKATRDQTAILTEFKIQTTESIFNMSQNISDIKDTLKFLLHKEIETERKFLH